MPEHAPPPSQAPHAGLPHSEPVAARRLRWVLLLVWAMASFGVVYAAHDLQFIVWGWPWSYWVAAQGAVLVFIAIVALYCVFMNRLERDAAAAHD